MITELEFDIDGGKRTFPAAYMQTGPNTQVVALGIDFNQYASAEPVSTPGVEAMAIGKLSEWGGLTGRLFQNSLVTLGWDFATYPDPELVQLEKIEMP